MGHTNATPNYNLPQFVGTDKPTFLGDINGAFLAIDGAIAGVQADADSAISTANTAASTASGAVETANSAATTAASAASTATTAASTANTAADTANNAQSTAVLAKSTADSAAADAAEAKAAAIRGSVEVTADGVKTTAALLNELYANVNMSKITPAAVLARNDTYAKIIAKGTAELYFSVAVLSGTTAFVNVFYHVTAASSTVDSMEVTTTPAVTHTDTSSTVPTAGTVFAIYY